LLWIGGVGFVTTALIPGLRRMRDPAQAFGMFGAVERRFAPQARLWVILTGLSCFYMAGRLHAWSRLTGARYWWMDAMVLLWALFAVLLFVIEPLLSRRFAARAQRDPNGGLRLLGRFHWVLLLLSLVTVAGAVARSYACFGASFQESDRFISTDTITAILNELAQHQKASSVPPVLSTQETRMAVPRIGSDRR
jgi:uncharacterized membrane protein